MITLIVARARNSAIGRNGTIPWTIPQDLAFFQRETLGGALIMGRTTWESLPFKPLPKRLNIVVSRTPSVAGVVVPSVSAAVELALAQGYQRIYGIGGARIYSDLMPVAHRLLISEVSLDVPDADTFFPPVDLSLWRKINERPLWAENPACWVTEYMLQS